MKDLTRRIIAWIGLVFALAFATTTIMTMFNQNMFGGTIGFVAFGFFILAIVPYGIIYFDNKNRRAREEREEEERKWREEKKRKRQENAAKQGKNAVSDVENVENSAEKTVSVEEKGED